MSLFTKSPRGLAIAAQNLAADPNASVLVSANAGSGKTHVLINRVTRILLAGAAPEQILCVTYTKAAASEMLNRLFAHLGRFSILADQELREELRKLDPKLSLEAEGLAKARRLFARALETPGGLKIRTIHGFCESLLRQFPIEAGISPGFTLLDDHQSENLQEQLIQQISQRAAENPKGELAAAFELLGQSGSGIAAGVFENAKANSRELAADLLGKNSLQSALQNSANALHIGLTDTEQSICEQLMAQFDPRTLQKIAEGLGHGAAKNQAQADLIVQALSEPDQKVQFHTLTEVFLNKTLRRPAKFVSNDAIKQMPELPDLCLAQVEKIEAGLAKIQALKTLRLTKAALILSHHFVKAYALAKQNSGFIDFDDLIEYSRLLLTGKLSTEWVLYKLDGNLRHVLVDEAQDNSAAQWQVIGALTDEFFAGLGVHDETRTLFAVGDPKQSIYGFQGADPSLFVAQKNTFLQRKANNQARIHIPQMSLSWRSSPQVLQFVDACFSNPLDTKFVGDAADFMTQNEISDSHLIDPGFANYLAHGAERANAKGSVTLLPYIAYTPPQDDMDPARPVDAVSSTRPQSKLAFDIASRIKKMLESGEQIEEVINEQPVKRAITAGDILILVRSRNNLFREIIRHLKLQSVPVAGADRMVLQSETCVLDLLSIAKAALQPADDLSLAEVLTGPFLHPKHQDQPVIDGDVLYDLAHNRQNKQSLYEALMLSKAPELAEAKTWIADLVSRAGYETPYRFFSGLLYRASASSEPVIDRMFARLGMEAADPVQEFLGLALTSANNSDGSLLSFVMDMQTREDMIKRELQAGGNAVRVMTVHGAKGLEAPMVILPDTNSGSRGRSFSGLVRDDTAWFWVDNDDKWSKPVLAYRDKQEVLQAQEHKRLLYVALTRARDHLLICAHQRGDNKKTNGFAPDSWYGQCEAAFEHLAKAGQAKAVFVDEEPFGFQLGELPQSASKLDAQISRPKQNLPDWVYKSIQTDLGQFDIHTPSTIGGSDDAPIAVTSPIGQSAGQRFLRGNLIHSLLQSLPDLALADREDAAIGFLAKQPSLTPNQRCEIFEVTMGVLNNPEFSDLFGQNSRAELPISGTVIQGKRPLVVNGKIDRLVVSSSQVLVLDYKTNRPPPTKISNVPKQYVSQMATYRALLRQVWPQKQIRCALLWTDGPNLMELPEGLMDDELS